MKDDAFRKKHGLPRHPTNWAEPAVPKLPPPPEEIKEEARQYQEAWQAWDAAMIVSGGDLTIADPVFDRARKLKKEKGK